LEFDLDKGTRGSRHNQIEQILCLLTGAEAALVVNNNASAVLLGITALAKRKEVVISRGQSVEIGGGFRIPDVMRQSGAKLVEVGTTNRTYVADFEAAINQRTAGLMRIHSSNFKLVGFTSEVSLEEMVALGKRCGINVLDDLGSGCFLDTASFGLAPEPTVQHSVALGAGLTFFSGDKLVGGPQTGIIVGEKLLINRLKKHPLVRAIRIDKVSLAGLIATVIHYLRGEATTKIPVWRMISMSIEELDRRVKWWEQALGGEARVIPGETMIGGGSLPGGTLPTKLIVIGGESKHKQRNVALEIYRMMSHQEVPVIGRISEGVLLLDPRTVLPEEDETVIKSLRDIAASIKV
jgi:L-seryl-tRNA(Ser) seleniumtransferase